MAPIIELNDEELVRCVQQGDANAFTSLYERNLEYVYRRVRYSIPEPDVEDVTQEVFIAMIRSLKEFRGESRFRTWLCTLISRKIADYYRHRDPVDFQLKSATEDEEIESIPATRFECDTSRIDDGIYLRQALRQLPQRYQDVILLRFADCLPFIEIAAHQGQSLEATKSLFRRAISMLQQILEETHA